MKKRIVMKNRARWTAFKGANVARGILNEKEGYILYFSSTCSVSIKLFSDNDVQIICHSHDPIYSTNRAIGRTKIEKAFSIGRRPRAIAHVRIVAEQRGRVASGQSPTVSASIHMHSCMSRENLTVNAVRCWGQTDRGCPRCATGSKGSASRFCMNAHFRFSVPPGWQKKTKERN